MLEKTKKFWTIWEVRENGLKHINTCVSQVNIEQKLQWKHENNPKKRYVAISMEIPLSVLKANGFPEFI